MKIYPNFFKKNKKSIKFFKIKYNRYYKKMNKKIWVYFKQEKLLWSDNI